MRKGHIQIIKTLKEFGASDAVISEFEKMTDIPIKEIRSRMQFVQAHPSISAGVENAYLEYRFFIRLLKEELDRGDMEFLKAHGNGNMICRKWLSEFTFLHGMSHDEIADMKKKYEDGIYDAGYLISLSMLVYPYYCNTYRIPDYEEAFMILDARRKAGLQEIVDKAIYISKLFSNIPLEEKLQAEKMLWEDENIRDEWTYNNNWELFDRYSELKCIDAYPGLLDICKGRVYLWEEDKTAALEKMLLDIYKGQYLSATLSGSPYSISSFCSSTGINIRCKHGYKYEASIYPQSPDGSNPKVNFGSLMSDSKKDTNLLLMYDGKAYARYHSAKSFPLTLKKMSSIYRENQTMKQILDAYMDRLVDDGGYMWKDIRTALEKGHVPPILVNDILDCKTLKDMMQRCYKESDIYNWNRGNLLAGYLAMKSMHYICPEDKGILVNYINTCNEWDDFDICKGRIEDNCRELLMHIIAFRTETQLYQTDDSGKTVMRGGEHCLSSDGLIISDYVRTSREIHRRINLHMHSIKRVKELHDDITVQSVMKKTPVVKIPKNSVFRQLDRILPKDRFERIKTRTRLIREGVSMHHCVATYAEFINRDKSAIYSYVDPDTDMPYTIEFRWDSKLGEYYVRQMSGVGNSTPDKHVYDYVKNLTATAKDA